MVDDRRPQFAPAFPAFADRHGLEDWEGWWARYDEATYRAVFDAVAPDDVVLEIGAGDLRLALRLAAHARRVVAVEVNPLLVAAALARIGYEAPCNLHVVCANALDLAVPGDVTVGVLLMRHCRHFAEYAARLQAAGAGRLVTNARWGMDVEVINFADAVVWADFGGGWYACLCGRVGFQGDDVERADGLAAAVTVRDCPACG